MENNTIKKIGIYDDCLNPLVCERVSDRSLCLDVGCWTGNMGRELIQKHGCVVDGLDFNEDALSVAKSNGYRNTFNIDLNSQNHSFSNISDKYDFIIFADVLEHLIDANKVLINLKERLNENGQIVISLPNIAFILYRVLHLLGIFDYDPNGGIMDSTHLKFYTLKTARSLVEKSGYRITFIGGYSLVKDHFFYLRFLGRLIPSLFALQLLISAEPLTTIQ